MKKAILFLLCLAYFGTASAQFNMSLISQVDYNTGLNDVWGYADPDTGIEYALVGAQTGVSIVSLEDPENPVEVAWIPGEFSIWRDLKTYGKWCYVVTDQNNTTEGVTVIDLNDLPNSAPYYHWTPDLPGLGTIETCHNLYIEQETGYCYLAGCDVNNGGILVIDVFTTPGTPIFVSAAPNVYSHDVYVRGDTIYSSEIYAGVLGIYDAADKSNIQFLAERETPFQFTHNAWLSDDSKAVFTTDEQANAPVAAYDISDLSNIQELDLYYPLETLGEGVIPHNVHVWNDWIIISYYSDGGIIVDAAHPDNLIEVGNFDTFLGGGAGFNGAWGAYPFLPSGIVLVTDQDNGLFVLDTEYKRACYLEGKVTSSFDGSNLSGVDVDIDSPQLNASTTDLLGEYKTGQEMEGTFDVTFSKSGYVSKTVSATLESGEITILDVELDPIGVIQGSVVRDEDGDPVPNAKVRFIGSSEFEATADVNGNFQLVGIEPGPYEIAAGAWGYVTSVTSLNIVSGSVVELTVGEGYYDDFALDLEWESTGNASTGDWEWVIPQQSTYYGQVSTPGTDVPTDIFDRCYVTGNGGNGGSNDVDDGTVTLTSPAMDLSDYNQPILSYQVFFFNDGGFGDPNDELTVSISNGIEEVQLESFSNSLTDWTDPSEWDITGLLDLTDDMHIIFETTDLEDSGNIVEAAVDAFQLIEGNPVMPTSVSNLLEDIQFEISPNPSDGPVLVSYDLPQDLENTSLEVIDLQGRILHVEAIPAGTNAVTLDLDLPKGMYILRVLSNDRTLSSLKMIR